MSAIDVVVVEDAGFCFGVKRALQLAERATGDFSELYCLGQLIHNNQVVEGLVRRGMRVVDDISDVQPGAAALIRAHGAGPSLYEQARSRGIEIIDATCPFVRRVQEAAQRLVEEDYQVLVLGERDHPEARAIVEHAGGRALIVETADEADDIELAKRVAIVCQTTQSLDNLHELADSILERTTELHIANTICDATSKRQEASLKVAREVDLMIVIGGYHSANTTRLAQICQATGTQTHHIETADELRGEWLQGMGRVGITAGASTPLEAMEAMHRRILELSASDHGEGADDDDEDA